MNSRNIKLELLGSAQNLLEKKGIYAFSMRDLLKVSSCSSSTLYRYFKNKDDVILHLYLVELDRYLEIGTALSSAKINDIEKIIAWLLSSAFFFEINGRGAGSLGLNFFPSNPGLYKHAPTESIELLKRKMVTVMSLHQTFFDRLPAQGWIAVDVEVFADFKVKLMVVARGMALLSMNPFIQRGDRNHNMDIVVEMLQELLKTLDWQRDYVVEKQKIFTALRSVFDHGSA